MKNTATTLNKVLVFACTLGLFAGMQQPSFAKLSKTQKFESVDSDSDADDVASEDVEEEVIVKKAPRKVKRTVIREESENTEVVPVNAPAAAALS